MPGFYEFFAGAGMAREGLGKRWNCLFANEFDVRKTAIYKKNWPTPDVLDVGDVGKPEGSDRRAMPISRGRRSLVRICLSRGPARA